jgi:hypothetical protein
MKLFFLGDLTRNPQPPRAGLSGRPWPAMSPSSVTEQGEWNLISRRPPLPAASGQFFQADRKKRRVSNAASRPHPCRRGGGWKKLLNTFYRHNNGNEFRQSPGARSHWTTTATLLFNCNRYGTSVVRNRWKTAVETPKAPTLEILFKPKRTPHRQSADHGWWQTYKNRDEWKS